MRIGIFLSLLITAFSGAAAHEVRPAIADVLVNGQTIEIEVEVNLEAILAGINLSVTEDTNDAPPAQAAAYNALRALTDDALAARFEPQWPRLREQLVLSVNGARIADRLTVTAISVTPEPDTELPRATLLTLEATLDAGTEAIQIGWARELGPLVVRQTGVPVEDAYTGYLTNGAVSVPISTSAGSAVSMSQTFFDFIFIGFQHIVPKGLDHILFVLGLFFLSLQWRPLVYQITAFTVAHTVTLALATLGYVSIPAFIVEPLIAASIVYVAIENIFARGIKPWRTWIVFGFGLLHGLGFASVLGDAGLNPTLLVPSLIGFNIGVEFGQLTVIAVSFLAIGVWFGDKSWYRSAIATPASLLIAAVGAFWFVERVFL
ncbi:MAG: HupE/UreJ family protein [Ahrensia sp.]